MGEIRKKNSTGKRKKLIGEAVKKAYLDECVEYREENNDSR